MTGGLLRRLQEFVVRREASQEGAEDSRGAQDTPLTQVNRGLRDMAALLAEVVAKLQEVEKQQKAIRAYSSNAWSEREALLTDYYSSLRGILRLWDNCEDAADSSPQMQVISSGLKRMMKDQRIEPIQVKEGDLFDARLHECEEAVETEGYPSGAVVQVIEAGYMQERRDGTKVLVRPAKVRVSKETTDAGGEAI